MYLMKKKNKFTAIDKNELLEELIHIRKNDLQDMFDKHKNSLSNFSKDVMKRFFSELKKKDFLKKKKSEIKLMCYNSLNYLLRKYKKEEEEQKKKDKNN